MKLRNKTTGEIVHVWEIIIEGRAYNSLAEIKEDYEDIHPKEPLIQNEKIRKAVRAWADVVDGSPVCFYEDTGYEGVGRLKIYTKGYPAIFDLGHQFYELELDNQYTIDELCGDEE